jgi:hypothetical protein
VTPEVRTRFPPVTPNWEVAESAQRPALNRQIVRSIRTLPTKLAAGAIGSAPRSERGGSRFETWAASQVCGLVGEIGRPRFPVTEETAGSNPVRPARVHGDVDKWLSHRAFNAIIEGSIPSVPASYSGVAKRQCAWLLTRRCAGSNPAPGATSGP